MSPVKVIQINENVFANNDVAAEGLRQYLKKKKVFMMNIMSSPGSGKTTTLTGVINALKKDYRIALMNVDIRSSKDADTIANKTGVRSLQINNGGLCHIDADMTTRAIQEFGIDDLDFLILENIGNLVCPAEFDTGAHRNVMILSVPEGDDKPLKYPLMFSKCDIVLINKIDTLDFFEFDMEKAKERILHLNPKARIIPLSAKTGEGMETFVSLLREEIEEFRKEE